VIWGIVQTLLLVMTFITSKLAQHPFYASTLPHLSSQELVFVTQRTRNKCQRTVPDKVKILTEE